MRSSNSRTNVAQQQQQQAQVGYSRREIEERSAAADKLYQQQLQQQSQQPLNDFNRTMPELSRNYGSNSQGRLSNNQNEANNASFAQSFPGNALSSSSAKLSAQQQEHVQQQHQDPQQQKLFSQVQQQIQSQPGLTKHRNNSNNSIPPQLSFKSGSFEGDSRRFVEVGLDNLGNTCFMNSTLQCLLHIQPLIHYFLTTTNLEQQLNLASPQKGVLATSFYHLVQEMYKKQHGSNASISPINFQKAVCCLSLLQYLFMC